MDLRRIFRIKEIMIVVKGIGGVEIEKRGNTVKFPFNSVCE